MTQPEVKPILLVSGGPATQPLWKPLAESYDLAFLYPQAAQQASALNIPSMPLAALMDDDLLEQVENTATLLATKVVNALPTLHVRFANAYLHAGPVLLNSRLDSWFAGYAHHILNGEIAVLAQLERLAGMGRHIAGCLTHEDVAPDTRALVSWCNARGLPSVHLPHAPCHLLPGVTDIHRETRAQWVLASGPRVAQFYRECGVPDDHIITTGGPQWDELYDGVGALPGKSESRNVLGITHSGPVLCYMSTWGQTTSLRSEFEREFDAGWSAVLAHAQATGAYLMVMIHWHDGRAELEENYAKALEVAGVAGLVTRNHKTYVLRAADCLIAQGPSNMCIEAAILGTPSCYLQTQDFDFATALPYRGTPETIGTAIGAALAEQADWGAFAAEYNAVHPHGGAIDAAVEQVRLLCK